MMIVNYNRVDRKHCYTTTTGGGEYHLCIIIGFVGHWL